MKILIALMIAFTGLIGAGSRWWAAPQPQRFEPTSPVLTCAYIGLRPEGLVLAGLTPTDAAAVLQRLSEADEDRSALAAAAAGFEEARAEQARLIEAARAQPANEQVRTQLQAQETASRCRETALEQAKTNLWSIAFEGVNGEAAAVCAAVRDTVARGLPPEAAIADLTPEQLRLLRQLGRTQDGSGSDIDDGGVTVPPAVEAARARLASELPAMLEVFALR